jgi:putative endonuclease
MSDQCWWIYMIRTAKNQLYTGITTNVERRFKQHNTNKGAKFLRGKQPLTLEWFTEAGTHSDALKLEIQMKKWNKAKKEEFLKADSKKSY